MNAKRILGERKCLFDRFICGTIGCEAGHAALHGGWAWTAFA
jgi:hypothetical protein